MALFAWTVEYTDCFSNAISFIVCVGAHWMSGVKMLNDEFLIATLGMFCAHFKLCSNDAVPYRIFLSRTVSIFYGKTLARWCYHYHLHL